MQPRLSRRVRGKKFKGRSKGFSSIVGAIFMVVIVWILASSYFVWTLSQNTVYNEAVREKNQYDLDRTSESVDVSNTTYTKGDNKVSVSAELHNLGPVSVQFTTLWIQANSSTGWSEYNWSRPNMNLQPSAKSTLNGSVTIMGVSAAENYTFTSWLITARGNIVPLDTPKPQIPTGPGTVPWALVSQGIGAFQFDFTSFKYYIVTAGTPDTLVYSSGLASYRIPWGGYLAFSFNLTNLYPDGQDIRLDESSVMWSYFPASPGQVKGPVWHIVNVNTTTGVISPSYSPITLFFNQTTEVFFAKGYTGDWAPAQKNCLGAVNLLLYGVFIGTNPHEYAQNIPFVSVYAFF